MMRKFIFRLVFILTFTITYSVSIYTQCNFTISPQNTQFSCLNTVEDVVFTNLSAGVSVASNNLTKTGANGWDGGASSTASIQNFGKASTVISETNTRRMFGLSSTDVNASYNTIQYAIYLQNNGSVAIYESGTNKGYFGTYSTGDTANVSIEDGIIVYYINSNVIYTSTVAPILPLIVDVSIFENAGTLNNVTITNGSDGTFLASVSNAGTGPVYQWQLNGISVGTNSNIYTNAGVLNSDVLTCILTIGSGGCAVGTISSNNITIKQVLLSQLSSVYINTIATSSKCNKAITEVIWTDMGGNMIANGTNLTKNGADGWNGGAASYQSVADNGMAYTVINETNTRRMFGLSTTNGSASYNTIDFAFYFLNNGSVAIYESGASKGSYGTYATGDTAKVVVEDGSVFYYINSNLLYTSAVAPTLPMIVDVSLFKNASTVENVHIVNGTAGSFSATVKNGGLSPSFQWKLNGVNVGVNSANYTNAALTANDIISCDLTPSATLCSAGTVSSNSIQFKLENPSQNTEVYINTTATSSKCNKARTEVVWTDMGGNMLANGTNLTKTGADGWNGGAASYQSVADNGMAYTVINETNTRRMFGLSNTNGSASYNTIDFAFYFLNNGSVRIYESGASKGSYGTYTTGDTAKVVIEDGNVFYYINNNLLYTSAGVPTLPMIVDVSLFNNASTIENVHIVNGTAGSFSVTAINAGISPVYQWKLNGLNVGANNANYTNASLAVNDIITCAISPDAPGCTVPAIASNQIVFNIEDPSKNTEVYINTTATSSKCNKANTEVVWTDMGGNMIANGTNLTKNGADGWNGGAASYQSVADNGMAYTVINETNTRRMFGLSNTNGSASYNTIDFAFYFLNNGSVRIYESGASKGSYGTYTTGDTAKVVVEDGNVFYYINNNLLYTSAGVPTLPMIVDVSLFNNASTIENVHIVNGTAGSFSVTAINAGISPVYQWKLNGVNVGTNSANYTNASLTVNDIITCVISPDALGCTVPAIMSNQITFSIENPSKNTEVYVSAASNGSKCLKTHTKVVWTDMGSNMTAFGNSLSKIGAAGWNGGAASYQSVSNNGMAYTIINETNTRRMFGLSTTNGSASYNTIDFAFYFLNNGSVRIYESGASKGSYGTYTTGDTAKVVVEDGNVFYYINSNLLYSSTVSPTLPMIVDVSLNDNVSTIGNVHVVNGTSGAFTVTVSNGGITPTYQWKLNGTNVGTNSTIYNNNILTINDVITCDVTPEAIGCTVLPLSSNQVIYKEENPTQNTEVYIEITATGGKCSNAEEEISWTAMGSNMSASGNNLLKTGSAGWDGGAASFQKVSDNGMVYTVISETNTRRMFGLSNSNGSASYNTIDFAFYFLNNGTIRIYESGSSKGSFGTYTVGDTAKIKVIAGIVNYYLNSVLLYTSLAAPTLPMLADVSIYDSGATLTSCAIENGFAGNFTATIINGGTAPVYQWKLNGTNVGANSPNYSNTGLVVPDQVSCTITPDAGSCAVIGIASNIVTVSVVEKNTTWIGGTTDWFTTGNWSNGVPNSATNAIIVAAANNPTVIGGAASCKNLTIQTGATLTMTSTENLTISGSFVNTGIFVDNQSTLTFLLNCDGTPATIDFSTTQELYNVVINNINGVDITNFPIGIMGTLTLTLGQFNTNNAVTILSNATGEGRIGEITGGTIIGNVTVQRYIDAGLTGWRFMAAPVNGQVLEGWNDDFITSGFIGSNAPTFPFVSIKYYDETALGDLNQGFVLATNSTTNGIGMGQGVWVWSGDGQTNTTAFIVDVINTIYTGNINLPVTYTNTGSVPDDGWNLVGNPYASALNWDDPSIVKTNVDNAIYIWNTDLQQYASYVSGIGTNGGTANIASSQGFYIKANAISPIVTVTEASKSTGTPIYLKSQNQGFVMSVSSAISSDQTVINLNPTATNSYEGQLDAKKLYSSFNGVPGIASILNGSEYSINQIPSGDIDIPVIVKNSTSGTHTLTFSGVENLGVNCVTLEDLTTSTIYPLTNSSVISFNLSYTTNTPRFILHIGANETITSNNLTCFETYDGAITYDRNGSSPFDAIWKDLSGTVLFSDIATTSTSTLSNVSAGSYILSIEDQTCGISIDTILLTEPLEIIAGFETNLDTLYLQINPTLVTINQTSNATLYNWNFGDGISNNGISPSHIYSNTGDFLVTLDAINDNGCQVSSTKWITILDEPLNIENYTTFTIDYYISDNLLNLKIERAYVDFITLYNASGKLIYQKYIQDNGFDGKISLSGISNQIIFVVIKGNDYTKTIKISLVR